ncbi:MAG: phosphate ABC transporter ATP-binding protein [Ignavibacteriales bacterium UTCHB1]|nr:MAG: phosphate ABC transporter ATP-binding protein [Ignavibacteriales bacterium UTCHB1]
MLDTELKFEEHQKLKGKDSSKFAITTTDLSVHFGLKAAIKKINLKIRRNTVTSIIGPSGCGKSTLLRSLNLMHELTPRTKVTGTIKILDKDITEYDVINLRNKVGMVFQKPNPFPKMSIYENVISGYKLSGKNPSESFDDIVERCLIHSALWDEVKDRLNKPAISLSGGQQQRLCIARTIAINPEIILMDEPTSALDPLSTMKIEKLIHDFKNDYTIIIVTHNMQQAARVSDFTAFMFIGDLVEFDKTKKLFTVPTVKLTEEYITGKFG